MDTVTSFSISGVVIEQFLSVQVDSPRNEFEFYQIFIELCLSGNELTVSRPGGGVG
jgi:hypothetical protein